VEVWEAPTAAALAVAADMAVVVWEAPMAAAVDIAKKCLSN
jgi:hypothetical protein